MCFFCYYFNFLNKLIILGPRQCIYNETLLLKWLILQKVLLLLYDLIGLRSFKLLKYFQATQKFQGRFFEARCFYHFSPNFTPEKFVSTILIKNFSLTLCSNRGAGSLHYQYLEYQT